ncbi:MAG: hypothetical protein AB8Y67_03895 [Coxiella-like endosymbiont]
MANSSSAKLACILVVGHTTLYYSFVHSQITASVRGAAHTNFI